MINPVPKPVFLKKPKKRLQAKGRRLFRGREDDAYQDYIRGLPCVFCIAENRTQTDPTEVEHIVNKSHGGYDRGDTLPGCGYHREQRHVQMGTKAFARYYGKRFDLKAMAQKFAELYEREVSGLSYTGEQNK